MKLNQFISNINSRGVLKSNKYFATISFPRDHYLTKRRNAKTNDEIDLFRIRCDSVNLPGMSFLSADGPPRLGYGPIEKHPYGVMMDDISLSFIVDARSNIHKLFFDWVNCIVNFQGYGASSLRQKTGPIGTKAYEVGYRDKYAATLNVYIYKDDGNLSMTYTIYNAFPMAMPSVQMNWNNSDNLRITIPFAYTDYMVEHSSKNDKQKPDAADPAQQERPSQLNLNSAVLPTDITGRNDIQNA